MRRKNPVSNVSKDHCDSFAAALFHSTAGDGVRAKTALFEQVFEGLSIFISRYRESSTEVLRFPPVMSRAQLEKSGYLSSFPHLLGCVSCLHGSESEIRALVGANDSERDWTDGLSATDLVLAPAACYPVYPFVAGRAHLPAAGQVFDVASYCFRREATHEIDRLQAFQMREYVFVGTGKQAQNFRARWMSCAEQLAERLCLPYRVVPASDPFFGRVGKLAAMVQVEQELKFEWLIPILSEEQPTACMSFNYHRDHFGTVWGIRTEDGETAHTACVAFGLDRLVLALFSTHGLDLQSWPKVVRESLSLC
jgi:seryl-tRNA synthetase